MAVTPFDKAHVEFNFIDEIKILKARMAALERTALAVQEDGWLIPPGILSAENGFLTLGPPQLAVISAGVIAITKSFVFVDTEGGAAADNLDRIEGGVDGALLILRANDSARTVNVVDGAASAVNNIRLDATPIPLDHIEDTIILYFDASQNEEGLWLNLAHADQG